MKQIEDTGKDMKEALARVQNELKHVRLKLEGPLIAEIKVKDALIMKFNKRDEFIKKELRVLKAITRTPRMYHELRKAQERKEQSERRMSKEDSNGEL
jgi:hypothetical protein